MKTQNLPFNKRLFICSLLFGVLFYFPVFHHLEKLPILIWDESLFALRALYIHLTGDYLYNFNLFEGMSDHANTKLPFTTFFQVIALKVWGISELSIRLPIVLIYTLTVIYIIYHFKKRFDYIWSGFVFGLVGITSIGFVEPHILRTGDQDAPYACYMLLATIAFVRYVETQKTKPLVGFAFWSIAAVLTKNLLAGLLAPGLFLFALFTRNLIPILKDYKFWLACFTIVGVYGGVVLYYEIQYPDFFVRMWNYELVGRYTQTIESHDKPLFFYTNYLAIKKFVPYFFMLPIIFSVAFMENVSQKLKHSILCFGAVSFCYLLILSFSKTQTYWYIAPIYLLGAYMVAVGSIPLFRYLSKQSRPYRNAFIIGLLCSYAILYINVLSNTLNPVPPHKDEKYGRYMKITATAYPDLKQYTLVDNNFGTSACFYKEMYNRKGEGYNISYQRKIDYHDGQIIMTCLNNVLNPTAEKYHYEVLKHWKDCRLLRIISKK